MTTNAFTVRKAEFNDHSYILELIEEVASEIPVKLDSSATLQAMKDVIVDCCGSGESLIAVDSESTIVGFVLAKPDNEERFFNDNKAVSLRYIGVAKRCRGQGIFTNFLETLKAAGEPLTADVLNGNQSGMADRLSQADFVIVKEADNQRSFRWASH